ncbi:MAG: 4-alpha-glucanotransferase [Clostridia bacterium]|nr:4-alpha-glucanotransferase [Clostridia bacterium]
MRESGILLHITSLPSPGGIGTLGREARDFCDFLKSSGMNIWQVLPVGPTGYGESPYQSTSSFAGNPMLIDLEELAEAGYLKPEELPGETDDPAQVDFDAVRREKDRALRLAYGRAKDDLRGEMDAFTKAEKKWLPDYALFMAVKGHFGGGMFTKWPAEGIKKRNKEDIELYQNVLADEIGYQIFQQYLFDRQWKALKAYANGRGISLMGDMPIYAAEDSCDVWAAPELFLLDSELHPTKVAGVPPDYFCEDGQLWGNPIYNWKRMRKKKYAWWIDRLRKAGTMYDLVRIDHFIGFGNYYAVDAGLPNARIGKWEKGPGKDLFKRIRKQLPDLQIVAEDLGVVSKRVAKLLDFTGYPGMKIMTFGFGTDETNGNLPENYPKNCVAYTGTHDNDTLAAWYISASDSERRLVKKVLKINSDQEMQDAFLTALFESRANRVIVPMQDILGLGAEARMNRPGTVGGNWLWRMRPGEATKKLSKKLRKLNEQSKRGNRTT